jgi:hypothetical protein
MLLLLRKEWSSSFAGSSMCIIITSTSPCYYIRNAYEWCAVLRWSVESRLNWKALSQWTLNSQPSMFVGIVVNTHSVLNWYFLKSFVTRWGYCVTFFLFFGFGIHIASVPSTARTSTGGDAVLGNPEGSPARRHSRNSCHMFVCIMACACSRHVFDFKYHCLDGGFWLCVGVVD